MVGRVTAVLVLLAFTLAACGGSDDGGTKTLNFFIFNEPGGGPQEAAKVCSEQSEGRYRINFEYLPSSADQQREQLVRRLGAEDDTIDLIGMDVVWTGEFANAGWIAPVPEDRQEPFTGNVFEPSVESARFEDKLYAIPWWSNTQLLWYRKDRVDKAPETWDELLQEAERLGDQGKVQIQGNRYEGLVVWANAMIESAGAQVLSGPSEIALEQGPTERALALMGRIAGGPWAPPDVDTSDEDTARLGFEAGDASFMVNYPFVFPSAEANAPEVFEQIAAAKYPKVDADKESKPPLGGINIGVSAFSDSQDLAFEAAECLVGADNQVAIAKAGGLPPVREDLYDQQAVKDIYPGFSDVVADSIRDAAPRPAESPAYQDLSLAIQRGVHPASGIDPEDPTPTYDKLRELIERAIKREGLL